MMHKLAIQSERDNPPALEMHRFRLYIAGESVNSVLAQRNLLKFCETYYPNNYHIERVDVLLSPDIAWAQGVVATPMLVRLSSTPNVKIMGNLNDTQQLINGLICING